MPHAIKFTLTLSLCLLIISAGFAAAKPHTSFYPDSLLEKLGIDARDIEQNREKFKNDPIHAQWMAHVHDTFPAISREKNETIIKTHTSLLFIKDRLNTAYVSGKINKQEFTTRLTELMKWFQEANQSVLSEKEYNALFGLSGQDDEMAAMIPSDGNLGFPIKNPETTAEMIRKTFDDATIRNITLFYQDHARELRDIREIYETGNLRGTEAAEVRNDMQRAEKELAAAYRHYCRKILSDDQFMMLFGNQ